MNRDLKNNRPLSATRLALLVVTVSAGALSSVVVGCSSEAPVPPADEKAAAGHEREGHEGHGAAAVAPELVLSTEPAEPKAGEPVRLRAMIHRPDGSKLSEFEETHEKLIHLIVVRDGLDRFAHLHPEVDEVGNITTEYTFPTGGRYLVYADHKPADGAPATARAEIRVGGEVPSAPVLAPDVPGPVSGDGLTAEVTVDAAGGNERRIAFELFDEEGRPVSDLEPYLGALGHVVILSADGRDYVHAHPLESGKGEPVTFEAHFTSPGLYKGWAQFQRSGRVLTVPFALRVGPPEKA